MFNRVVALTCIVTLIVLAGSSPAFAWGPVTHYHINNEAFSVGENQDTYNFNGTGPDMFIPWEEIVDYAHSPNPKEVTPGEKPYWDTPNFTYLMLKVSGFDSDISSLNRAYGFGWGGHISADWIAHNRNLFPIEYPHTLGHYLHIPGEALYDIYMCETRGFIGPLKYEFPVTWRVKFSPSLIYKAMANYKLIELHEKPEYRNKTDEKLKADALDRSPTRQFIEGRCGAWTADIATMEAGYFLTLLKWGPTKVLAFRGRMINAGAEENISLSEQAVYNWANHPREMARVGIPNYDGLVIPFDPTLPTYCPSLGSPASSLAWSQGSAGEFSAQSESSADSDTLPDLVTAKFWQDIATGAEDAGILQTQTERMVGEEGEEYIVTVTVTDKEAFGEVLENVIEEHIQNPSSDLDKKLAVLWKNMYVEEISDPALLADRTSPIVTAVHPAEDSFTNDSAPCISAAVEDDPGGIGLDLETVEMTLDGIKVEPAYVSEVGRIAYQVPAPLVDGKHIVTLKLSDKADNWTEKSWSFNVDTVTPQLSCEVKNKIINIKKQTKAEVLVTSSEPVTYKVEIFRVKDMPVGDKGQIVYTEDFKDLAEQFTVIWDGKDNAGGLVANGVYTIRITASDRASNTALFEIQANVNNEAGK